MPKIPKFKIFLCFWITTIVIFISYMSSWHHINFANVVGKIKASEIVSQLKSDDFKMVHFIAGQCQCSEYIVDYLIKRGPISEGMEKIVIYDDVKNFKDKLVSRGFIVSKHKIDELEDEENAPSGIPLLIIVDPKNQISYEGGYSNQVINPFTEFKDLKILNEIKSKKRELASLPAYGCAISKKYQKWLDPLNIKYKEEKNERI